MTWVTGWTEPDGEVGDHFSIRSTLLLIETDGSGQIWMLIMFCIAAMNLLNAMCCNSTAWQTWWRPSPSVPHQALPTALPNFPSAFPSACQCDGSSGGGEGTLRAHCVQCVWLWQIHVWYPNIILKGVINLSVLHPKWLSSWLPFPLFIGQVTTSLGLQKYKNITSLSC